MSFVAGSVAAGLFNGAISTNQFLFQGVAGEPTIAWFLRLMTASFCFPAMFGSVYRAGHTLMSVLTGNHQDLKFTGNMRIMTPYSYMAPDEMDRFLTDNGLWILVDTAHKHILDWWATDNRTQKSSPDALGQQLVWLRLMVRSFLGFKHDPAGLYMCFKHATSKPLDSTLGVRIANRPPDDRAYGPHGPLTYYDGAWRGFVQECARMSALIQPDEPSMVDVPVDPLPRRQCQAMVNTLLRMAAELAPKAQGKQGSPPAHENDGSFRCGLLSANFFAPDVCVEGFEYLCILWAKDSDWSAQLQARCHQAPSVVEVAPFFQGRQPGELPSRQEMHIVKALFELHTSQLSTVLQKSSKRWQDPLNFKPIKSIVEWRQKQPSRDYLLLFPKDNKDMIGLGANLSPELRIFHGFEPGVSSGVPNPITSVPAAVMEKEKKPKDKKPRARRAADPPDPQQQQQEEQTTAKEPRVKRRQNKPRGGGGGRGPGNMLTPSQMFTVPSQTEAESVVDFTPGQTMMADQHEPLPVVSVWKGRDERRYERSITRQRTRMAVKSNMFYGWTTGCRVLNVYCQSGTPFATMTCNEAYLRMLRDEVSLMLPPTTNPSLLDHLVRIVSSHWSLQALFLTGRNPTACLAVGREPFTLATGCVPANLVDQVAVEGLIRDPYTLQKMVSSQPFLDKPHRIVRALIGPMHKLKDSQVIVDMFNTMFCPEDASDPESGHSILLALWPRMACALIEISMAWLNDWSVVAGEPLGSLEDASWDHMYTVESVQRLVDQLQQVATNHPSNVVTIEHRHDDEQAEEEEEQLPDPEPEPVTRTPICPPADMSCDPRDTRLAIPRPSDNNNNNNKLDIEDTPIRHLLPSLFPIESDGSFFGY